jgi:hypothetical protein
LRQSATGRVKAAANGIQVVYASIQAAGGVHDEARFSHWAFGEDEGWNGIGGSIQRSQCNLRIRYRRHRAVESRAAAANRGLRMALRAAVAVKPRSQTYAWLARYCSTHGKYSPELIQGVEPKDGLVQVERWYRSAGARRASSWTGIDLCCNGAG